MRTTIDIPDTLFRKIKAAAALQGESLKTFLIRAAEKELPKGTPQPGRRVKLPIVESREDTYDVSPERLNAILEEEDRELLA